MFKKFPTDTFMNHKILDFHFFQENNVKQVDILFQINMEHPYNMVFMAVKLSELIDLPCSQVITFMDSNKVRFIFDNTI